jgi:thiamine biosynthesis lipoprotein
MTIATEIFHKTIASMNSSLDMVFTGIDNETAQKVSALIEQDAYLLERVLSRFDPESETFQVNQSARGTWTEVGESFWAILQECEHYRNLTAGYFNVALGVFKQNGQERSVLSEEMEAGPVFPVIAFDEKRKAIRLDHGASLDFGAVGKGLLLREIQKRLNRFGVESGLISFGGSSVLAKGGHPYGSSWPVSWRAGLDNPTVFHLNETCASFSGAVQTNSEGSQPHIVHPKKLQFIENNRLVFVQSKCPVVAEVLSTSLVVANKEDFYDLISQTKPERAQVFKRTDHGELITEYDYEANN